MKRAYAVFAAVMMMAIAGWAAPAAAVPPTATPSPGYDARLQQSRAAPTVYAPVAPVPKPLPPRKKKQTN